MQITQYKYGYLRAKGFEIPDDKLVLPKGPVPSIQLLNEAEAIHINSGNLAGEASAA